MGSSSNPTTSPRRTEPHDRSDTDTGQWLQQVAYHWPRSTTRLRVIRLVACWPLGPHANIACTTRPLVPRERLMLPDGTWINERRRALRHGHDLPATTFTS